MLFLAFSRSLGYGPSPPPLMAEQITDENIIASLGDDLTSPPGEWDSKGETGYYLGKPYVGNEGDYWWNPVDRAFDNDLGEKDNRDHQQFYACGLLNNLENNQLVIGYTFNSPKLVTAYAISVGYVQYNRAGRAPKTFALYGTTSETPETAGSSEWVNLCTGNATSETATRWTNSDETTPETRYYKCKDTDTAYRAVKLVVTENNRAEDGAANDVVIVSELEVFGLDAAQSSLEVQTEPKDVKALLDLSALDSLESGTMASLKLERAVLSNDRSIQYQFSDHGLKEFNPETFQYDIPVESTLTEDALQFQYEAGKAYRLSFTYAPCYRVRAIPFGAGAVTMKMSDANEAVADPAAGVYVSSNAHVSATLTATATDPAATDFLVWNDSKGTVWETSGIELEEMVVDRPIDLTAFFWQKGVPVEWYVKPGGDDAADGLSEATAKATIRGGIDAIRGVASTVYVLPGTYAETDLVLAYPVRVLGKTGNPSDVIIDGASFLHEWYAAQQTFQVKHADAVVAGLTIRDAASGYPSGFSGDKSIAVFLEAGGTLSNCVVRACKFYHPNCRGAVRLGHERARVTRCLFMENESCSAEDTSWYEWAAHSGVALAMSKGLVDNCVFVRNTNLPVTTYRWSSTAYMDGGVMANCSFFENTGNEAGALSVASAAARVYNTVFYGNALAEGSKLPVEDFAYEKTYSGVADNFIRCASDEATMLGTGGIANVTKAAFRDYDQGDCRPDVRGVIYKKGRVEDVPAVALAYDFSGAPRKKHPDIGAFEAPEGGFILYVR